MRTAKNLKFTFHWLRVLKHCAEFRQQLPKYSDIYSSITET